MKDKTIDYVLRTTWLAVNKMYNEEAAKFGTTMATGFTLLSIDQEEGTPSTSLGPIMGMEATSLSRILKRMEELDLIVRRPNPNDGRGVLIYLTPFGKEKRKDAKERVLVFNEAIREHVSDEKLKSFYEVSDTINELIPNKKIFHPKEPPFKIIWANRKIKKGADYLVPELMGSGYCLAPSPKFWGENVLFY